MKTAIIGAGIAGLSAARSLKAAGQDVKLFDKGRGPGGRLSTRRAATELGELRWDHGAPFFEAGKGAFRSELEALAASGAVASWSPRIADVRRKDAGWTVGIRPMPARQHLYVGQPTMNAVIKGLAAGLQIDWGRRVSAISVDGMAKTLAFEDGTSEGPFDQVFVAVPAEQAAALLEGVSPQLAEAAAAAKSAPRWVAMLAFDSAIDVPWDVASIAGSALSMAVRNASKPGRDPGETWVLHASPDWSREHVDVPKEEVAALLAGAFSDLVGAGTPSFVAAHRWLYGEVAKSAGGDFGWDEDTGIGAASDWWLGPSVEAAWTSGAALADSLTGRKLTLEK